MHSTSTSCTVRQNPAKMPPAARKIHDEALYPNVKYTDIEKKILQPINYVVQNKGNQRFGKFFAAVNSWIGASKETMLALVSATSPLYDLTITVDDIQDGSYLRRGLPCAHVIFGFPRTLSALTFGLVFVFDKMAKTGKLQKFKHESFFGGYLVNVFLEMLRGQAMDIFWREFCICPTEEEWKEMTSKKTGTGVTFTIDTFNISHPNKEAIAKIGKTMGLLFQIRDDYLNLTNENYMKRKGFCEDLDEGKYSFPVIHAIHSHPEDKTLFNILKQPTKDDDMKRRCLSILRKYNSLEYTKEVIHKMEEEIKTNMQLLEKNSLLIKLLDEMDLLRGPN